MASEEATAAVPEVDEDARDARKKRLVDAMRESAAAGGTDAVEFEVDDDEPGEGAVVASADGPPEWAKVPPGMAMPEGWVIYFVRFRADWTNTPKKGDRTVVMWNLSESDEKNASKAARGDGLRLIEEMSKRMIRSIDGVRADWTGQPGPANVNQFWSEIGGKCRYLVKSHYLKTHTMNPGDTLDFFEHCVASRSAG